MSYDVNELGAEAMVRGLDMVHKALERRPERATPLTDAVGEQPSAGPELDYFAMRAHAEKVEQDRARLIRALARVKRAIIDQIDGGEECRGRDGMLSRLADECEVKKGD